jgi:hypothetical protein
VDRNVVLTQQKYFLLVLTALLEGAIGLLLLAWPSIPQHLLLGVETLTAEAAFFARIAGAALVALAIICWRERSRGTRDGLLPAVLFYNVAAAGILAYSGWSITRPGLLLWPAVGLHAFLAICCAMCWAD